MTEDKRNELHRKITAQVLALMESHGTDWVKPWASKMTSQYGSHHNHVTRHEFTGWNPLILSLACHESDWSDSRWATFKQWRTKNCTVRKGSKGTTLLRPLFKNVDKDDGSSESKLFGWSAYNVFNACQVDGLPVEDPTNVEDLTPEFEPDEMLQTFVDNTGAVIKLGGTSAFYMPSMDSIGMPNANDFTDSGLYWSTLFHELTHWTGHETRCNRSLKGRASRQEYAFEELIAEIGAAFLCVELGVDPEPRADHAQYLNHWIAALKEDNNAIAKAATQSSKAVKHLHSLQPATVEKAA